MDRVGTVGFRCVADAALGDNSLRGSVTNDPRMSAAAGGAHDGHASPVTTAAAEADQCAGAQQLSKL
eukprot:COSAG03_NODE_27650_length_252_cov_0.588235_1_plen_67_part_10